MRAIKVRACVIGSGIDRAPEEYDKCEALFVSEYGYHMPASVGAEAARIQNDNIAQAVEDLPERFAAFGATVPLQDVDMAIAEMDRAVDDLGFKGLQIGGTIAGRNLDELRFRPFWQAVAAKGIPVILHPNGYEESHRFGDYFMTNCINCSRVLSLR